MGRVKSMENVCGCHVADKAIVYCDVHSKAFPMARLLNGVREYFLDAARGGVESPIVKRIDTLLPRNPEGRGAERSDVKNLDPGTIPESKAE
jgi:hypothetical protein